MSHEEIPDLQPPPEQHDEQVFHIPLGLTVRFDPEQGRMVPGPKTIYIIRQDSKLTKEP